MEAYCDGLNLGSNAHFPGRMVTERDLRELGAQYNMRDDMERMHQSRINVMREKQSKQMEVLSIRQDEELNRLRLKAEKELELLQEGFTAEDRRFFALCRSRRGRLRWRWTVGSEIARRRMEEHTGDRYGKLDDVNLPEIECLEDSTMTQIGRKLEDITEG
jgi:hypothetical protein